MSKVPVVSDNKAYKETRMEEFKRADHSELYPHKFSTNISIKEFVDTFEDNSFEKGQIDTSTEYRFAGRVMLKRSSGKKLHFYTLRSDGVEVQVLANKKEYKKDDFNRINKLIHRGDTIGAVGYVGRSNSGELSLIPIELQLLTPCLKMFPRSIVDPEIRARQRYLDMAVNQHAIKTVLIRSQVVSFLRKYLENKGFHEVHTPVVAMQAGGASAKPFKTYHNDLKSNMYLRIAPELNLKRLIVGGLEKVFEIGPQFRNESIDRSHSPEFYSLEYYWAYADYFDLMEDTEKMLSDMVKEVTGSYTIIFDSEEGKKELDFTPPFKRICMVDEIEKEIGEKLPSDLFTEEARLKLIEICDKHDVKCSNPKTTPRLLDKLAGEFIEHKCQNPTFLIDHPLVMSPLAKVHRGNPALSERFELFVSGMELCNAYTEQNDAGLQEAQFTKQIGDKDAGDDEAPEPDYDYINALNFGLPPTAGFGLGIDRIVMLLANKATMRDVIPFPVLAEEKVVVKDSSIVATTSASAE